MTNSVAPAKLHEAGGRIPFRDGTGDKYKVRIMGWEEGADVAHGSSADYPVEVLKRDVPLAFPEGTRMRANHDGICESGGDIRRVIARTIDTPWAEADGMYTNIRVSSQWSEYVKEYGDIIGLSISAAGELQMFENEDGDMEILRNAENGQPILKSLLSAEESPYNSIDFVEAPGADGRIVLALESARSHMVELNVREQAKFANGITERNDSKAVPPTSDRKENSMDPKEIEALVERSANAAALKAVEALKPAEPSTEVKYETVAEAAFDAGLPKTARAAVYEAVRGGKSVEEAIAEQKTFVESLRSELTEGLKRELEAEGYTTGPSSKSGFSEGKSLDKELEEAWGGEL